MITFDVSTVIGGIATVKSQVLPRVGETIHVKGFPYKIVDILHFVIGDSNPEWPDDTLIPDVIVERIS